MAKRGLDGVQIKEGESKVAQARTYLVNGEGDGEIED